MPALSGFLIRSTQIFRIILKRAVRSAKKESVVIGLDENVVNKTIEICKLHRIKLPDAIIAASAMVNNLTLLTRNISDFKNIEEINLYNPWED